MKSNKARRPSCFPSCWPPAQSEWSHYPAAPPTNAEGFSPHYLKPEAWIGYAGAGGGFEAAAASGRESSRVMTMAAVAVGETRPHCLGAWVSHTKEGNY